MKQNDISEFATELGFSLSQGQIAQLEVFEGLLHERAIPSGMISRADSGRLRTRHILDSLRAVPALRELPPVSDLGSAASICDLGSGAGLPGVVVAIALPESRVLLAERRPRRAAFLEFVCDRLELGNAAVAAGPVEKVGAGPFEACLSRAFAPLAESWRVAANLLGPAGLLVYFAGQGTELPELPEKCAKVAMDECPLLESSGPLVIMTRK